MSHTTDRTGYAAAAKGLAVALLITLLGLAGTCAAADDAAQFQLAQAKSPPNAGAKAGGPQSAAQPAGGNQDVERQIADLNKKLKITAAQQPQFDAFAQVVRQNSQAMDALTQQQQPNQSPNAVEALRASIQLADAEAEGLKRLLPVMQSLYDSLSDQQKRTADQTFGNAALANEPPPRRR